MLKKITLIIGLIFISYSLISQNSVNDYKYVVVPNTFEFLKEPNKYGLNILTKLHFEKHGFTTFMEDEALPEDAFSNACLILNADVIKEKGFLITKLKIQLKNCKGEIIYTSQLGKSKEKKYQVAYTLSLRQAFGSIESLNYSYQENPVILSYGGPIVKTNNDEVEKLKEEITQLKEEKEKLEEESEELPVVVKPVTAAVVVKSTPHVEEPKDNIVVHQELTKEVYDNVETLYAQPIKNGFQLVDSTPKVIFKIKKTGMINVFLVEGQRAIIYQLDANWIYEYYENEKLKTQILNIKF